MKITRFTSPGAIRAMCIREQFYTKGTNKAYDKLLQYVSNCYELTDFELVQIASDIARHSDCSGFVSVSGQDEDSFLEHVVFCIVNYACTYGVEFRDEEV